MNYWLFSFPHSPEWGPLRSGLCSTTVSLRLAGSSDIPRPGWEGFAGPPLFLVQKEMLEGGEVKGLLPALLP